MLLSQVTIIGSLHLLAIVLVSMLVGAGLMTLRQRMMRKRLRLFHQRYGAAYMTPGVNALLNEPRRIS